MGDQPAQTQGYLSENPDFFSGGKQLLSFLPDEYDLFYRVEHTMDNSYTFSFELEKMATFSGTSIRYSEESVGICESEITVDPHIDEDGKKQGEGGLVYINWLFVEDKYRRMGIAYYLLYSVFLFADSKGCHRVELVDGSGQSRASYKHNIYSRICLQHVDHKELVSDIDLYASVNRSRRLKSYAVGYLPEIISRLESGFPPKESTDKENVTDHIEAELKPLDCDKYPETLKLSARQLRSNLGKRKNEERGGTSEKKKRLSRKRHSRKRHSRKRHSRKRRSSRRRGSRRRSSRIHRK